MAVVCGEKRLSYRELNERVNQLAHYLRGLGVKPNTLVAISIGRSVELVIAIYGVLKAGAAYLPVDPSYPQERLEYMLQSVRAPVLITQGSGASTLQLPSVQLIDLDSDWPAIEEQSEENPSRLTQPSDLIYVIFPSGSTGRPKGAGVYHQ